MKHTVKTLLLGVIWVTIAMPSRGQAQGAFASAPESAAVEATIAAVRYLIADVDSLESVSWPSARSLLMRRPGIVELTGISTGRGEDPATAIALTDQVATALNSAGVRARPVPRQHARYCGIGNSESCTLPDEVSLLLLIGYALGSNASRVAQITIVADSGVRAGRPVISLEITVESIDSRWTVTSVRRVRVLSE